MKGSDKAIVLGVLIAVVLGIFFFTVLAPKRDKASQLGKDISGLHTQVSQEQQTAQFGEQARSHFPVYYSRLVVLGKAVPDSADTASLMVQLSAIAKRANVQFTGITLAASSGGSGTAPGSSSSTLPPTTSTPTSTAGTSTTGTTSTTPAPSDSASSGSATATPAAASTASAPATETSAASLPIGASVGPGNLGVMPYNLSFAGSYFQVADFIQGLDDLIHTRGNSQVAADGRLLTIDGFSLSTPQGLGPNPRLSVAVAVTSFVTPTSQGLTAGASPTGPAPATAPLAQPASATVGAP